MVETLSCTAMATRLVCTYICEGPEWPANLNSDCKYHTNFFILNYHWLCPYQHPWLYSLQFITVHCEYCFAWGLFLVWYDHVINECFTKNMNIAKVLRHLAYSFKRHVYVMDYYFDMYRYDEGTLAFSRYVFWLKCLFMYSNGHGLVVYMLLSEA